MSCYGTTAVVLSLLTMASCIVSFVVPHWLLSWQQKQSTFDRIGLWEVCFTAFADPKLYAYKYYAGCWWIFHPEVDLIRDMLNPAWFKAVQGFAVITMLSSVFSFFFILIGHCKKNWRTCGFGTSAALTLCTGIGATICVLIFGSCAKDPKLYRLPMPQYNYFGSGFGLMCICALSAGFCFAFILGHLSVSAQQEKEKYKR